MKGELEMICYTIEEARALVKLSRSAFYKLLKAGTVPAKKCGSRTLIPASDFEQWFKDLPNRQFPKENLKQKQKTRAA
ncbi:MAG: helix-turn-helix domain-containing protein [Xanthobacteraceae bacterium]